MTSRIVPVYIDLTTGRYVVKDTEVDDDFRVYLYDVVNASDTWVITHGQNTKSLIIKTYKLENEGVPNITPTPSPLNANSQVGEVYEEIVPENITITSIGATITFATPVAGRIHMLLWGINSI